MFNLEHIEETYQTISKHVDQERMFWEKEEGEKYPSHRRVFVGGMSQGGVMALHYGLSSNLPPGGVIALSAYLLRSTPLRNES